MLFNSFEFILIFIPTVFLIFFGLSIARQERASRIWLVFSSLFFYGWWEPIYVPLILGSILFNFGIGQFLSANAKKSNFSRKVFLIAGISGNLGLLGYFKYSDFLIENWNMAFGSNLELMHLVLPLAISFFTFQQITFLVDGYKGEISESNFLNYFLFVLFFPQLIAGPIVHHKEMMPQFRDLTRRTINKENIVSGLLIFSIGLFKKVVIADTFAVWATHGFDATETVSFIEGWITSLSFTFQLYFDFSGYTDMALGAALLFNIRLPENFNSPYKALNIRDFWRRWHMTLSRFLKDYLYIPMGGNRKGQFRTQTNIMTTFFLCGLWHGAGWTYVFWGLMHGTALVIHRLWNGFDIKINPILSVALTFLFINFSWVFFRANQWQDAMKVLKGMLGFNDLGNWEMLPMFYIAVFLGIVFKAKNSMQLTSQLNSKSQAIYLALFFGIFAFLQLNNFQISNDKTMEFLYFNF
jgi:alginate O-acetyltransferase complex protein AlgI